jgi:hypothetical protein
MAIDPVTAKLLMSAMGGGKSDDGSLLSGMNPLGEAGTAILGGVQLIGGIRNLNKAKKMADPSFMSGAGEIKKQQARYGQLYDTGITTGQEDTMRERFRSNISGLQQKFRETSRQGSSVFSRLAGLNVNEGERAIADADQQARMMGLRGLGSTAESLTNISMRDIGTAKSDRREAIQAAGKAISSGFTNLASAANFMGMTGGFGSKKGGSQSTAPTGTNVGAQFPLGKDEYFDMGTPFNTRVQGDNFYAPDYQESTPLNTYGFSPSTPTLSQKVKRPFNNPQDFNAGYSPSSIMFK